MKTPAIFPTILLLLIATIGCSQEKSDEEKADELQQHVEDVHDVAMAKIGSIRHFQDTISGLINKMAEDTTETDSTMLEHLDRRLRSLTRADDQMMEWMRNYKSNNAEMEWSKRMDYLRSEEKKVIAVRDSINKSLKEAKAVIEKVE